MSVQIGGANTQGSKKTNTSTTSQVDPWDETIPYLKDFLTKLGGVKTGATTDQLDAFGQLKQNASEGNPYAGQIDALTNSLFGAKSRAPQIESAYADLSQRLTPTANGDNIDVMSDPLIAKYLQQVGDDAANRNRAQFAGAGRDMSGMDQRMTAEGVTRAQLPILINQTNMEKARTDAAARDLFGSGAGAAGQEQNLDQQALGTQTGGIATGNAALEAKNWGPDQILALEEQMKMLPADELEKIASMLFPAAGLGSQSQGTSTSSSRSNETKIGGGLGFKL